MLHDTHRLPLVLLEGQPAARALIRGDEAHPALQGEVLFYPYQNGSLLLVRVLGLPGSGFLGFHIHALGQCRTGGDIPFYCAGAHYNPLERPHPEHAGDLPVLLSAGGMAFSMFYTDRFRPQDVLGRSVLLHERADDYRTQPAGDTGGRIACGVIEAAT